MKKDPSDPVWKRIEEMSAQEKERCRNDERYYYNKYLRRNRDTELNEQGWQQLKYIWELVYAGKMIAKPRLKNPKDYPLL